MRGIKMTDPLFDVSDKIVIITGGLGQIGAEFVKEFYRRGSKVAVIARSVNPERIQKTLGTELAESERIAVYALDIQNKSEINTFLDTLEKKWGSPDVLVNNAGIDTQRGLPHAHGHALAFFAAHADAAIERHIVADHAHMFEYFRPAADDGSAFHGVLQLAVFHPPRFGGAEHEFAAGDVPLPAAEVHGIQPALQRRENLVRLVLAAQHERIGHAWHGQMRKGLTPAIARHRHLHQPCIQRILQIALQHAVLDQHIALRGVAFIVDVERTAPVRQRAVIKFFTLCMGIDTIIVSVQVLAFSIVIFQKMRFKQ